MRSVPPFLSYPTGSCLSLRSSNSPHCPSLFGVFRFFWFASSSRWRQILSCGSTPRSLRPTQWQPVQPRLSAARVPPCRSVLREETSRLPPAAAFLRVSCLPHCLPALMIQQPVHASPPVSLSQREKASRHLPRAAPAGVLRLSFRLLRLPVLLSFRRPPRKLCNLTPLQPSPPASLAPVRLLAPALRSSRPREASPSASSSARNRI